jgi:hypothetical protein
MYIVVLCEESKCVVVEYVYQRRVAGSHEVSIAFGSRRRYVIAILAFRIPRSHEMLIEAPNSSIRFAKLKLEPPAFVERCVSSLTRRRYGPKSATVACLA